MLVFRYKEIRKQTKEREMFAIIWVNGNTEKETVIFMTEDESQIASLRNEAKEMIVEGSSDWLKVNVI